MEFDRFTIGLLVRRPDRPELTQDEEGALQDAHLAYLAKLHEEGNLLAAGPLRGGPDEEFRGLSIFPAGPERARELGEADPAVRAGYFALRVLPWMVPGGAMAFTPTRFPASVAEATGA